MKYKFTIGLIGLIMSVSLRAQTQPDWNQRLGWSVDALSRVMMHDVVNPPAAARYYAYCLLGAWQYAAGADAAIPEPKMVLRTTIGKKNGGNDYRVTALFSILELGKMMLPSGYMLDTELDKFTADLKQDGMDTARIGKCRREAQATAREVVAWSRTDRYNQLSAKLRYTPKKGEGYWYPTPPAYMEAVEPNWRTVRPMLMDTCNQFSPLPCVAFDKDSSSAFMQLAREVYDYSHKATGDELASAAFWDCNPFAVSTAGHLAIGFKKISPGGHWMAIAGIACQQARLEFSQSVLVQAVLGLTLMDAFISCWDEKYSSNRIRPETVINRYIDPKWQPLLQTPPFPEYTSGHSVVSAASAEVLTYFLGDQFAYRDSSEHLFGLPTRAFTSFRAAASEAAVSRIIGGIHFRDAVDNGVLQGRALGEFIVSKIRGLRVPAFVQK